MNNHRTKATGWCSGVQEAGVLIVKPIGGEMTKETSPFFFQSFG